MLQVGLVLFDCLCKEVMSRDLLFLAFSQAKDTLEKTTIDKKKIDLILKKYAELAEKERRTNPLHTMF
jgi:hypothetical protein